MSFLGRLAEIESFLNIVGRQGRYVYRVWNVCQYRLDVSFTLKFARRFFELFYAGQNLLNLNTFLVLKEMTEM